MRREIPGARGGQQGPGGSIQEQQMTSRLRFGVVSESVLAGPAWLDHARRIEDAGVGVLLLRDHFSAAAYGQQFAPFSALAAAAAVTARLHVGTLVLANDFRHPVIVAHEAASLHQLSGGRFELGLGAGWYRPEYEAAGLAFQPARQRIDRLEESLAIISGLLAGAQVDQAGTFYQVTGLGLDVLPPLQGRPRLVVGAGGPRMLGVAGRYADTVGLLPAPIKSAEDRDDPLDLLPAALDQKIAVLRDRAGDRFPALELSTFVTIWITSQRRQDTEALMARRGWGAIDVSAVWEMPTILIGSVAQIKEDLLARRERFGLSYLVTPDRDLPALTKIIASL
jgi:probable F420-dependent oxidoreductase